MPATDTAPATSRVENDATLREIAALARRVWREHYPALISQAQIDYMLLAGYSLPVMRDEIDSQGIRYALARIGDTAAGFAAHGPAADADGFWLHKLYVDAGHRRRGLARALFADALAHARERQAAALRLRVNRANRVAIRTYRTLGFRIETTDCKDIGGGFVMDDYIMRRRVE